MRLALMGGGATLALGAGYALWPGDEACRLARLENRPDAAAACRSGSSSSSARGFSSGSGGEASSASRGGFGASGHAAGS